MFTQLENNYAVTGPKDYKAVACQWLQGNPTKWSSWIAPPFACTAADMGYTAGQCSDTNNRVAIEWYFIYPKSCQGGLALPQGESVACDVVPSGSQLYLVVGVLTAVMVTLIVVVGGLHVYCMLRMQRRPLVVQQVGGWWLVLFALGLLCLGLTPIVSVSGLTEAMCRGRVFLTVLGFSFALLAVHQHSVRLLKAMSALLATSNPRKDVLLLLAVQSANLLIMLLATLTPGQSLLSLYIESTPAGATVPELYCEQPPLWSISLLCILNGLFALRCAEMCVRSVLKMRSSARLYKVHTAPHDRSLFSLILILPLTHSRPLLCCPS
jgi:hypothetical protein